MRNSNALEKQTVRRILLAACAFALAVAFMVARLQPAQADTVTPPPVPDNLKVPEGARAFLVGHAVGTQNYICLPRGSGFLFVLFTPEATLFDDQGEQIITHFFSPNLNPGPVPPLPTDPHPTPDPKDTIRATWQDSRDTSIVWARAAPGGSSTDPDFVEEGAIPWVLLQRVGVQEGPTGGDRLTKTTFVQRLNTSGGAAPATECASSTDVGKQAFVPYTADYFFYRGGDGS